LKRPFFLDLSMVDRRLHDDLRRIYLHLKAPRFDLRRAASTLINDMYSESTLINDMYSESGRDTKTPDRIIVTDTLSPPSRLGCTWTPPPNSTRLYVIR
jgi:hypothetical protein